MQKSVTVGLYAPPTPLGDTVTATTAPAATTTVDLPGSFAEWLEGTSLVEQPEDNDEVADALRTAFLDARVITRGRSRTHRVTVTADTAAELNGKAGQLLYVASANSVMEPRDRTEAAAARKVQARCADAVKELLELQEDIDTKHTADTALRLRCAQERDAAPVPTVAEAAARVHAYTVSQAHVRWHSFGWALPLLRVGGSADLDTDALRDLSTGTATVEQREALVRWLDLFDAHSDTGEVISDEYEVSEGRVRPGLLRSDVAALLADAVGGEREGAPVAETAVEAVERVLVSAGVPLAEGVHGTGAAVCEPGTDPVRVSWWLTGSDHESRGGHGRAQREREARNAGLERVAVALEAAGAVCTRVYVDHGRRTALRVEVLQAPAAPLVAPVAAPDAPAAPVEPGAVPEAVEGRVEGDGAQDGARGAEGVAGDVYIVLNEAADTLGEFTTRADAERCAREEREACAAVCGTDGAESAPGRGDFACGVLAAHGVHVWVSDADGRDVTGERGL